MARQTPDPEALRRWARVLTEESLRGGVRIIVEGRRDAEALESLGVRGRFMTVREIEQRIRRDGSPAVCGNSYVILTDFDSEGMEIRARLESELSMLGATIVRWPVAEYLRLRLPTRVEECSSRGVSDRGRERRG